MVLNALSELFEGPCTNCEYKPNCTVYPILRDQIYNRSQFRLKTKLTEIELQLDRVSKNWLNSVAASKHDYSIEDLRASLSALFDFLCSALYAREALKLDGGSESWGIICGDELIFPYTWMCPRCVSRGVSPDNAYLPDAIRRTEKGVTKDYPDKERLAKPGARAIGDVGIKVLSSILRVMLSNAPGGYRMTEGSGQTLQVDLTFASYEKLIAGEVKAKPLIAFPVIISTYGKPNKPIGEHHWRKFRRENLENTSISLYVAAAGDFYLDVGCPAPDMPLWPLERLTQIAGDKESVRRIVQGWRRHLDAYRTWKKEDNLLRWHRFGCGNIPVSQTADRIERRVANTKELPGLDRTDDIKKGTSQVMLFARLKLGCHKKALRSALLGNLYAETHHRDYLDHLSPIKVTMEGYDRFEWLFDLILGLSRNLFFDPSLAEVFDTTAVIERVKANLDSSESSS